MTEALPTLTYGTVVGRYLAAIGDTTGDADTDPEEVPLAGTITFTPSATGLITVTTPGDGIAAGYTAVVLRPITATLDNYGYLGINGTTKVELIASDNTNTNPTGFTWQATFALSTPDNIKVNLDPVTFTVPGGTTISLPHVTPASSTGGVITVQGATGQPGKGLQIDGVQDTYGNFPSAGANSGKVWEAADTGTAYRSNGTTWVSLGSIKGPTGDDGLTPAIQAAVEALSYGQTPTVTVTGDPANPLITFGLPAGAPGNTTALINDSAPNATTTTFSANGVTTALATNSTNDRAYTDTQIMAAINGIPSQTGTLAWIQQASDGSWPGRGSRADGVKVIWIGLALPPTTTGYAVAGDGAQLVQQLT